MIDVGLDQELGRAMAAPVLGEQGQTWLEKDTQRTSGLVENNQQGFQTIQNLANEAQSLTVIECAGWRGLDAGGTQ
jgi:hypothetical protein